jgi:hypothetical protein
MESTAQDKNAGSFILACTRSYPELTPRIGRLPAGALVAEASLVVLARVTSVDTLGPRVERAFVRTRVWRVHLHVESVVKGECRPENIVFYMYNYDERIVQKRQLRSPLAANPRLLLSTTEKGVFRAVRDLYQTHIDFLRPGVPRGVGTSLDVAGFRFTQVLVAPLLRHPDERVRDAACMAAVDAMFGGRSLPCECGANESRSRCAGPPAAGYTPESPRASPSESEEVRYFFKPLSQNRDPLIASSARRQLQLLDTRRHGPNRLHRFTEAVRTQWRSPWKGN